MLGPLFEFYFFRIVPFIGSIVAGDADAYSYLPHSTVNFPEPAELAHIMELAGMRNVVYHNRMMGTVAIHVGTA
jgi:demethylmenaquinone methyltransferase/2-methoxy-6-polyprenyl-1,4-benzoquinol methylase